jgi:ubiquinone/menaquinone biosynthesis C-methylase UbiE
MIVNWPERIWCNSIARRFVQAREVKTFQAMRPLPSGLKWLEIGCGNGAGAVFTARAFAAASVAAFDLDPAMISLAKKRLPENLRGVVSYMLADAQHIPAASASLDAAVNFGIIHHLEDWDAGIREVARVLKPGGAFYFEEIYPPLYANALMRRIVAHPTHNRFHGPEFKNSLAGAGLALSPGYRESRFGIIGVAVKH